ncbi:MAG: helix-turn-helix domain-containing protein [Corallococcus sp.]|nr:helix-turn-helix domain-containing protein [Corallococcus sp.]MCM1359669.1 helix-turn-helix domain-containing protein [Corallococcus sp.]MCM1395378.1 helix-turn-helix domain-containing protein [Corallococcus sp.]
MKNELTVLKSVRYAKAIAKKLDEECKTLALSSFCTLNFQNGTLGQVRKVADLVCKRDVTERYFQAVVDALGKMPGGYRALLFSVYVKNVSKTELCRKYAVSVSTLYRKLAYARQLFAQNLQSTGAREAWFSVVYCALSEFYSALKKRSFEDAFDVYCASCNM